MIRVLLASALAFVGVGAAVTSLSPDLLAGPHGEPLVMVTPGDSGFQAASLDGGSCGTTFLLATPNDVGLPSFGWGVMAFTTSMNADNIAVVLGDLSDGPDTSETVVLMFDSDGRLVSADDRTSLDVAIGNCAAELQTVQPPI